MAIAPRKPMRPRPPGAPRPADMDALRGAANGVDLSEPLNRAEAVRMIAEAREFTLSAPDAAALSLFEMRLNLDGWRPSIDQWNRLTDLSQGIDE